MKIIRLKSEDYLKLEAFLKAFSFKNFQSVNHNFLTNPLNYILAAYADNLPVGYLLGYELERPETDNPTFFVYDIEVLKDYRKKGIGTELMDAFKQSAKEKKATEIFVASNKSNIPAMNFYRKSGYIKEKNDDIIMINYLQQHG